MLSSSRRSVVESITLSRLICSRNCRVSSSTVVANTFFFFHWEDSSAAVTAAFPLVSSSPASVFFYFFSSTPHRQHLQVYFYTFMYYYMFRYIIKYMLIIMSSPTPVTFICVRLFFSWSCPWCRQCRKNKEREIKKRESRGKGTSAKPSHAVLIATSSSLV